MNSAAYVVPIMQFPLMSDIKYYTQTITLIGVVSTVPTVRAVSISHKGYGFVSSLSFLTCSGTHPASYPMGKKKKKAKPSL
jgi:hypothetical protein